MAGNKINPALHLQVLIMLLLVILLSDYFITLLFIFSMNILFLIYHKVNLVSFFLICKKLIYFNFGISVFIAFIFLDIHFGIITWIKLTLITTNILYYFQNKDWTELFYAFDCILWPLDYMGMSSSKVAWKITWFVQNIMIYFHIFRQYVKKENAYRINFSYKHICGKIESTKEIFKIAAYHAKHKMERLDDMIQLRLFRLEHNRSNYYMGAWQPLDFVFLSVFIFLLASEVI